MITATMGVVLLGLSAIASAQVNVKHIEFFEAKIRPILVNKCSCHADTKLGGLRVDSSAGLLEGGKRGAVVAPGKPDQGLLLKAVLPDRRKAEDAPFRGKLKDEEIADLKYWIQIGAPWPHADLTLQARGRDHERLTYRYIGHDMRLTDIAGKLLKPLLA